MTLKLLRDLVLVKLAPTIEQRPTASGIILEAAITPTPTYGKVMQIGPRVSNVTVGDVVSFQPSVGDPLDGLFPTPHLIVAERQIDLVVSKKEATA